MSRILILSAHEAMLDRRIVSEAQALIDSGREATLLSVPTLRPITGLDPRIEVVVEKNDTFESPNPARPVARRLPGPIKEFARALWYRFGNGPAPYNTAYFLRHRPDGPFDAIHCHDLKTLPAGVEIRARFFPSARLIYDAHEFFPFQSRNRSFQHYWKSIEKKTIVQADLTITVNESIARAMEKLYAVPRPKVLFNSYGVDGLVEGVSEESFLAHFGASKSSRKRVFFQGNLSADRNLHNLVSAFGELSDRAELYLLGDGAIRSDLERIHRERKISNVFFGDWVQQERLLGFVRQADLGIIPYPGHVFLNSLYCSPNKLFEFIEAGIPICASDLPELRRTIVKAGIGGVYDMNTPRQISEAVSNCLDRMGRGEFSREKLDAARERYAWTRQATNLLEWYHSLDI